MKTPLPCLALAVLTLVSACSNSGNPTQPPPTPPVTPPPPPVVVAPHEPVIEKELMITHLSVVNDDRTKGPDGPWSFGGLMKRLAGTGDVKTFTLNWLRTWESTQTINAQTVAARSAIRPSVINTWKTRDGQTGATDAAWTMNFANAPFRLLAIVNRVDLNRIDDPVDKTAGEGRYVFGVLGANDAPLPFTVIFEYRLIGTERERLRGWAQEWHALGAMSFGPQFNSALQTITDKFSGADGQLNQIRTNEIALALPWELREFRLVGGALVPSPTLQTPANAFQNTATFTKFIDDNEGEILDGTVRVPAQFQNQPFMAASSLVGTAQDPGSFVWQAPNVGNKEARHKLAVFTCNGCHNVETGTANFLHIANRAPNAEAQLSGFLTGIEVNDPANPPVKHRFTDLADRATLLKAIMSEPGAIRLQALTQPRRARVH